jgi:hypothetical protein
MRITFTCLLLCLIFTTCTKKEYNLDPLIIDLLVYEKGDQFKMRLNGKDTIHFHVTQRSVTTQEGETKSGIGKIKYFYETGVVKFKSKDFEGEIFMQQDFNPKPLFKVQIDSYEFTTIEPLAYEVLNDFTASGVTFQDVKVLKIKDDNHSKKLVIDKEKGMIYFTDTAYHQGSTLYVNTFEYYP